MENKGGQRLTLLRTTLNWTQPELAQKADISVMTVSRIENSKQKEIETYRRTLNKLAEKFGVNLNWLMEGKGSMWLSGTDEENIARIKAGGKTTAVSDPWKDEAYTEVKKDRDYWRNLAMEMSASFAMLSKSFQMPLGINATQLKVVSNGK